MKKRRAKLYLVGQDPADIFDNLDKLKSDLASPPERRTQTTETFARFPHDRALALYKYRLGPAAWAVMVELDRLILKRRGQNPVRFASSRLRAIGIKRSLRAHGRRRGPCPAPRAGFGAPRDPSLVPHPSLGTVHWDAPPTVHPSAPPWTSSLYLYSLSPLSI
jgi:hypothetical protein